MAITLYKDLNQFNPTDREYSLNERAVYQSIINILQTRRGERLFNPDFGVDLDNYIFDTMDNTTEQLVMQEIGSSIENTDKRILVDYDKSEVRAKGDTNSLELLLVFELEGVEGQTYQLIEQIKG